MVTDARNTEDLVEQVVVVGVYCWSTLRPASLGIPGQRDHHRAFRLEHILVTPDERDRGQSFGALTDPDPSSVEDGLAAVAELGEPYPPGPDGDAAISAMDASEAAGYVTQHSGEAQRVFALERARSKGPRKTILRAIGLDPDAELPAELSAETLAQLQAAGSADRSADGYDTSGAGGPAAVG